MNKNGEADTDKILLTQFSKGAGCGCKISPAELEKILTSNLEFTDKKLLVGHSSRDDAAVLEMDNGTALISTTDFFTPIVDDAFDFGRIAAANAISDIYAMGGKPLLAVAILGWPLNRLPAELAARVVDGAREVCANAGIALGGGHSIESTDPFFGLAVNGIVDLTNLKRNDTAKEGDLLFLTKPLGTGILSTAKKRKVLTEEHLEQLTKQLLSLNSTGEQLGKIAGVNAMTDITGFGLAGHLVEMTKGSDLSAIVHYNSLKLMKGVTEYLAKRIVPDATFRNWNSYQNDIAFEGKVDVMEAFSVLPDPQTNGGLLIAVAPAAEADVREVLLENGLEDFTSPIGKMIEKKEKAVYVQE